MADNDPNKTVVTSVDGDRHVAPAPGQPIRTTIPANLAAESAGLVSPVGSPGSPGGITHPEDRQITPIGTTSQVDLGRLVAAMASDVKAAVQSLKDTAQQVAMGQEQQTRFGGSTTQGTGVGGSVAAQAAMAQQGLGNTADQMIEQQMLYGGMAFGPGMLAADQGAGAMATMYSPFGHLAGSFPATEAATRARNHRRSRPMRASGGGPPSPPGPPNRPPYDDDNAGTRNISPVSTGDAESTDEMRGNIPEAPDSGKDLWARIQENREYNIGSLRQTMARTISKRLSQKQWGPQIGRQFDPGVDEKGVRKAGPFLWREQDPDTGEFGAVAQQSDVAKFLTHEKFNRTVQGAAAQVAQGEGVGSVLSGVFPEVAQYAGGAMAGVALAREGIRQAENQRRVNSQWQEIMGGSNAEGFAMRARSQMFGMRQMGTMGSADAQRLYEETNRLGYRGGDLQNALGNASEWYRKFGMSVEESSKLLEIAATTGQKGLDGFTKALGDVTKAARDAGVSAQQARANFTQTLAQTSEIAGPGNAPALATAATNAGMAYGGELGRTLSFANQNSPTALMLQARQMGTGVNGLIGMLSEPSGAGAYNVALARDRQQQNLARRLLGTGGQQMVQGLLRDQGITADSLTSGTAKIDQGKFDELSQQWLDANKGRSDVLVLPQLVEQMGGPSGLNQKDAVEYLLKTYSGVGSQASQIRRQQDLGRTRKLTGPVRALTTNKDTNQSEMTLTPEYAKAETIVGSKGDFGGANRAVQEAFNRSVEKTGRAGGISQLIKQGKWKGEVTHLKVKTKNGDRVVNMTEAMTNFRDQVDAGTAEVVGGTYGGQTVAQAFGVIGDDSVHVTSKDNQALAKHGTDAASYERKHGNVQDGKIIITGNPDLIRALGIRTQGNVSVDTSSRLSPPSPQVTQDQLSKDSGGG